MLFFFFVAIVLAFFALNFDLGGITGYVSKNVATEISITNLKPGDVLSDRMVARLELENSFPNQRIRVYRDNLDKFVGYSFKAKNCKAVGISSEYSCEANLYITSYDLEDGELYYFQALDRYAKPDGAKAFFTFKK